MNTNRHKSMRLGALAALLCFGATCFAAAPDRIKLTDEVREKFLTVLRAGLKSDEFWPSIHAAEGLTLDANPPEGMTTIRVSGHKPVDVWEQQMIAFRESVRSGSPSVIPAEGVLLTNVIMDGIFRSHEAGKEVAARNPKL